MTITEFQGDGTVATLDTDAQTLTLAHGKWALAIEKKKRTTSPHVIPLHAITDVQRVKKMGVGEVRITVRDGVGWHKNVHKDLNSFTEKVGRPSDEFIPLVRAAAGLEAIEVKMTALDRNNQQVIRERDAKRAGLAFAGIVALDDHIEFHGQTFPLAGARAIVEVGGTQRRTTATRVVVGSVVTLGVGTMIGAMAKKQSHSIYVTVELADGQVIVVEADETKEGQARRFTAAITSAGAKAATAAPVTILDAEFVEELPAAPAQAPIASPPPPPPPSVPADWYPDPDNTTLLRYWDGARWTEHTAPRVQQ